MRQVNMREAKRQLSRLVEQAVKGEDIVITKAGKPVARLVAYVARNRPRTFGLYRGQIKTADDLDVLPDDLAAAFEGD